jgi:small subunit ribosomal protein S1
MADSMKKQMQEFFEAKDVQLYNRGDILQGRVIQPGSEVVLVDIGYKSEAHLRTGELAPFRRGRIKPDEEIEVIITYIDEEEGTIHVSERQAIYTKWIGELERHYRSGEPVTGVVEDIVKDAGYHVNLKGIRAFLPGSHLGGDLPAEIDKLRGKEIPLKILELNRREKNLVVSHKAYLQDNERKRLKDVLSKFKVGDIIDGEIKSIVDFGLFVDIGGFEGLVHRTEISWKDLPAPPSSYKAGQKVKVKILDVENQKQRISLSIKQTRPDPWGGIAARYPKGEKFTGEVVAITEFGAFVRLEEDVEGLVHISELSWGFPEDPREVVKESDQVEVIVLDADEKTRRISLSMRRTQADPWESIQSKFPEGAVVTGKVTKLLDFGAFVELEQGVEALLHISEMSWDRVNNPADVVKVGDEVTIKVIKSDGARRKIRLSLRELQEDPWHAFVENYPVGTVVDGKITELKDFGAFCRITDEVEGLIHVSEISEERIDKPGDVLKSGDSVQARIIGVNEEKRQVRLSLRKPQEPKQQQQQQQQQEPEPRRERERERDRPREREREYEYEQQDDGPQRMTLREHLERKKGLVSEPEQ